MISAERLLILGLLGLTDLGHHGNMFTWERGRNIQTRIRERLDRYLSNAYYITLFLRVKVFSLPRVASNHCSIFLNTKGNIVFNRRGQKAMRLEPNLVKDNSCKRVINDLWISTSSNCFLNKFTFVIKEIHP